MITTLMILSLLAITIDRLWIKGSVLGAVLIAITGGFVAFGLSVYFEELGLLTIAIPTFLAMFAGALIVLLLRKVIYLF